tara:strand:- start:1497 stop:2378 length:882 start_codon:yes stop_codon:yes gene_type:complete
MSIPLNSNSQLKTLYLNSQLATKTNNIYNFEFATPIICPLNMQTIISVAEFNVPNVFPLFNSSNNVIATSESGTPYTLTIPDTIRNPIDFAAYWNGNKPVGYTATLVYNKQTFKFTFFSTFPLSITTDTTCGRIIGLEYINNVVQLSIGSIINPTWHLELPSTINFRPTDQIFIKSEELTLNNVNSFGTITNTLARVPVNTQPGSIIFYRPVELNRFIIPKKTIQTLKIGLVDALQKPLDIGSQAFQLLLKVEFMYPLDDETPYDKGSIPYFMKNELRLPDEEEEVEEQPFGV